MLPSKTPFYTLVHTTYLPITNNTSLQEFDKTSRDPALILRSSVNSYMLHAQVTYNLSVYRVELWKNDVNYTALTMTQWLEVGFPASVHDLPAILARLAAPSQSYF